MLARYNGEEHDVPVENWAILHYPNDIMDGMIIDLGENYIFLSAHDEHNREAIEIARDGGAEDYQIEGEVDLTAAPHCWVVQSLIRFVIYSVTEA